MTSKAVSGSQRSFRGDARRAGHAREDGLEDFADQRLLVSRRDHEREARSQTSRSRIHAATTSARPGSTGRSAATGSAARQPPRPAEARRRYRSAGCRMVNSASARHVAEGLRHVERHDGPDELPDAQPRVTQAARMQRLHEDDRSPRDARRFPQDAGRVARVRQHEEQQRGRERSVLERQDAVGDQDRRRSHDMDVAHVGGDHLQPQFPFQPGRDVSGAGAEVQHGSLGRQPCADLLHQLTRAPFHDDVKHRRQHSLASSNPAGVLGSYPVSTSCLVSRRMLGQKPRSISLGWIARTGTPRSSD